ncbi:MAG: hypothetical protein WDA06_00175 [Phenylobacterium sp.]
MADKKEKNLLFNIEVQPVGFEKASSVVTGLSKGLSQQISHVQNLGKNFSSLAKQLAVFAGATVSLNNSIDTFGKYNKQIISLSAQWNKYGNSITQVGKKIDDLSKSLNLTRMDVMDLASSFEKAFPYASLDRFEKILTNIKNVTGANVDQQKQLMGSVSQLVNIYPSLQNSVDRLNDLDKERLRTSATLALTTGKINRDLYSDIVKFAGQNKQISKDDEKKLQQSKDYLDMMGKMRSFWEKIALIIGKAVTPALEIIANFLEKNQKLIQNITTFVAKWVAPMLVIKGIAITLVKTFGSAYNSAKGLFALIAGGAKAGKIGAGGILGGLSGGRFGARGMPVYVTNLPMGYGGRGGIGDAVDMIGGRTGRRRGIRGIASAFKRGGIRGATTRLARQTKSAWLRRGTSAASRSAARVARRAALNPAATSNMIKFGFGSSARTLGQMTNTGTAAGTAAKGIGTAAKAVKGGGMLAKGAKLATLGGIVSLGGELAFGGAESYYRSKGNEKAAAGAGLGKSASSIGGWALTGSAIGSVLPGIGTGVGAGVGAIAGTLMELPSIIKNTATLIKDSNFGKAMKQVGKDISKFASQIGGGLKKFFSPIGKYLGEGIKTVGKGLASVAKAAWDYSPIGFLTNKFTDHFSKKANMAAAAMSRDVYNIIEKHKQGIIVARAKAEDEEFQSRIDRLSALSGESISVIRKTKEMKKGEAVDVTKNMTGMTLAQQQERILQLRSEINAGKEKVETLLGGVKYVETKRYDASSNKIVAGKSKRFKYTEKGLQDAKLQKESIEQAIAATPDDEKKEVMQENLKAIDAVIARIEQERAKRLKDVTAKQHELLRLQENRRSIMEEQKILMENQIALAGAEIAMTSAVVEKIMITGNLYAQQQQIKDQMISATGELEQKEKDINEYIKSRKDEIEYLIRLQGQQLDEEKDAQLKQATTEKERLQIHKNFETLKEKQKNADAQIKAHQTDIRNKEVEKVKITAETLNINLSLINAAKQRLSVESGLASAQRALTDAAIEYSVWFGGNARDVMQHTKAAITARKKEVKEAEKSLATTESEIKRLKDKKMLTDEESITLKQLNTDRLNMMTNIQKLEADITKLRLDGIAKTYEAESQLRSQQTSFASQHVQLMDNFVTGLGASVDMRMKHIDAMKSELDILQENIDKHNKMDEADKKKPEWQKRMNELKLKELGIVTNIANESKALRDGWVSAVGAMTIGSGRISKFVLDQNKSLGLAFETLDGMVRTGKSGAMGRDGEKEIGSRTAERWVAGANGSVGVQNKRGAPDWQTTDFGPNTEETSKSLNDMREAIKLLTGEINRATEAQRKHGGAALAADTEASRVLGSGFIGGNQNVNVRAGQESSGARKVSTSSIRFDGYDSKISYDSKQEQLSELFDMLHADANEILKDRKGKDFLDDRGRLSSNNDRNVQRITAGLSTAEMTMSNTLANLQKAGGNDQFLQGIQDKLTNELHKIVEAYKNNNIEAMDESRVEMLRLSKSGRMKMDEIQISTSGPSKTSTPTQTQNQTLTPVQSSSGTLQLIFNFDVDVTDKEQVVKLVEKKLRKTFGGLNFGKL